MRIYTRAIVKIRRTYSSLGVCEGDIELLHCLQDGHQALDGVTVDNRLVRQTLVLRVTLFVNNPTIKHMRTVLDRNYRNYHDIYRSINQRKNQSIKKRFV